MNLISTSVSLTSPMAPCTTQALGRVVSAFLPVRRFRSGLPRRIRLVR